MSYEMLASVLAIYGICFTGVLKIEKFVLKMEDKDIDSLLDRYHEKIINESIKSLIGKKEKKSLQVEQIGEIREVLNIPVEIETARKDMGRSGKWAFWSLIASGISVVISGIFPDFTLVGEVSFVLVPTLLFFAFIIHFLNYFSLLNDLKKHLEKTKVMIRNKTVI